MLGDLVYEDDLELTADERRLADEAAAGWQDPAYRRAAQFAAASLRAAGPRGPDGLKVVIRDRDDAAIDPAAELKRL